MLHTIPLNIEVINCSIPGHDHISHCQHENKIIIIQTYKLIMKLNAPSVS